MLSAIILATGTVGTFKVLSAELAKRDFLLSRMDLKTVH